MSFSYIKPREISAYRSGFEAGALGTPRYPHPWEGKNQTNFNRPVISAWLHGHKDGEATLAMDVARTDVLRGESPIATHARAMVNSEVCESCGALLISGAGPCPKCGTEEPR